MACVKFENVCYESIKDKIKLRDISLTLENKIYGLTGNNEESLIFLQLIGGRVMADSGKIEIDQTYINEFNEEQLVMFRRRYVGTVFRKNWLLPAINSYENIILPLELDDSEVDVEYIMQIADMLEISTKLFSMPRGLTKIEGIKVCFLRAMATKPKIILIDNTLESIDLEEVRKIVGILRMTKNKFRQTIVIRSKEQAVLKMTDHIIEIEKNTEHVLG